jgi:hypothetical protein
MGKTTSLGTTSGFVYLLISKYYWTVEGECDKIKGAKRDTTALKGSVYMKGFDDDIDLDFGGSATTAC